MTSAAAIGGTCFGSPGHDLLFFFREEVCREVVFGHKKIGRASPSDGDKSFEYVEPGMVRGQFDNGCLK